MIKSENIKTNVFNSNIYNSFLIQIFFSSTGLPLYLETWKNMEFENLGKKTWNLRNFEKKNLENPGSLNKNH